MSFLILVLFNTGLNAAIDPIRIMNYNLLNYPSTNVTYDTTVRHPSFRTIMAAVVPDILVTQEMTSQTGVNFFLSKVLNTASSGYAAGTFILGPNTCNAIFYKLSKFEFISNKVIVTELRNINEFKLRHLLSGDTIRVYAVHLKASDTPADEAQRGREVDSLRKVTNLLPSGSNFIVCGDFNIYSSTEVAYTKLKQVTAGVQGHVIDQLNMTGSWRNSSYAQWHTQSPRIRSFDGGITGGMDDRFDMILYSAGLATGGGVDYAAGSLVTYGNDGLHYNDSINRSPNNAVGQTIANALHNASDHIPVYATINFNYSSPVADDLGVQTVVSPGTLLCPSLAETLIVTIKNYSSSSINFSTSNLPVQVKVTNPSLSVATYSTVVNTGTLAGGATMNVTVTNSLNLSQGGTYTFKGYTQSSNDANHLNDTISININVIEVSPVTTTPSGNIAVCTGNSVLINASHGVLYNWSNGSTDSAISVSTSGSYFVTVTDSNGCTASSSPVTVTVTSGFPPNGNVFLETVGAPAGTTSIASYESSNGFDNGALTMSGTGDVRNTSVSSGYAGASGGGNVFLTSGSARNFLIDSINTSFYQNLQLSFGVMKSTTTSSGSDLVVRVSADSINYITLSFTSLPTGSGTATWHFRTASGVIPSSPKIFIQFINNSATTQYRIDDIKLTYSNLPTQIISFSPDSAVVGSAVVINGTGLSQTNSVSFNGTAATFSVSGDTMINTNVPPGSTTGPISITTSLCNTASSTSNFVVNPVTGVTMNFQLYIEGFYQGGGTLVTDTVDVELRDTISPFALITHENGMISPTGTITLFYPTAIIGNSYYLVFRHRNSMATWSKYPVFMGSSVLNFNLTAP
jgi:endonuclease/exonuclease/phosphatase family metal-dependent hydrolase